MSRKTSTVLALASLALTAQLNGSSAFAPVAFTSRSTIVSLRAEEPKAAEAVFLSNESASDAADVEDPNEESIDLDQVEMLGRGAAKVR